MTEAAGPMLPAARPRFTRPDAGNLLGAVMLPPDGPAILGLRGYYRDTMGVPGVNDRGIYDDAIAVVTPRTFATFNANTDPSRTGGRLAVLQPGVYRYKAGIHHPGKPTAYPCLVQAAHVTVLRDDGTRESGEFYIHIHRGGNTTTGSEGCQTIAPEQWSPFFRLVLDEMSYYELREINYALVEWRPQ
jgi:lysozyme